MTGLRLVFLGTPAFAVPSLERLLESDRHRVVGVVTQPDRPRGRGQRVTPGPVAELAHRQHLPLLQPTKLAEVQDAAARWAADLGVVVAYGRLLPTSLLEALRFGFINLHASMLPKYRGAAPIQRAVVAGDTETGVSIIQIVPRLDAGPILNAAAHPIGPDVTSGELEAQLAELGARRVRAAVDAIAAGSATATPQDDALATYAPRLSKAEGLIDWNHPAPRIHDHVRGLQPWPHAFTYVDTQRFLIHRTRAASSPPARGTPAFPGQILVAGGGQLIVQAGRGTALAILDLQAEGRRTQPAADFLAGRPLSVGERFGPPAGTDRP